MDDVEALQRARQAHAAHRWGEAYRGFVAARQHAALAVDDLLALGDAAWWLGHGDESIALTESAHQQLLDDDQPRRAAMQALTLGFELFLRGEVAQGSGWLSRARRLLADTDEGPEHGYVLYVDAGAALETGDVGTALTLVGRLHDVARRHDDATLGALALAMEGTARIRDGALDDGMALLDEAMLPVVDGAVAPEWAGNIYCDMMAVCHELGDLRRMREWTDATERWCEGFDSAAMFAGICRMHRVQLLQVGGDWPRAHDEARRVCTELAEMNRAVVAEGHYLLGDLQRLRGADADAEAAYRQAHELGRDPQPGLALLRLAQGRPDLAAASLATALGATDDPVARAPLCRAQLEVALATDDLATATAAADELEATATTYATDVLVAAAAEARGAVELAAGHPATALPRLRDACRQWQALDAPHDVARTRVLAGGACSAMGDHDAASLDWDAAAATFTALGASVDLRRLAELRGRGDPPGGLTPREAEVLATIATGRTNREAAALLYISEKTVARHLANVYLKLGLSTRTAAAAWAHEHGLVPTA